MSADNQHFCRLGIDEESHLDIYWGGKFSDFVHAAFKQDIKKIKNNNKKNRIQSHASSIVLIAIGFWFLFSLFNIPFFNLQWLMIFALGTCFSVWGLVNMFLEVRQYQLQKNK